MTRQTLSKKAIFNPDINRLAKRNQVTISGKIIDRGAVRHTPAGIMVIEFKLRHTSDQEEASMLRSIEFELSVIAMAEMAQKIAQIASETYVELSGFMTKKNRSNNQLILHVLDVKFI
ncbi:primosomal replication protein n [Nitrosomonas stercoris]|uniref:Replication restart protein PriB n=1 Tax=Nitrosomonas stercoris TaxID=1444684 RepID=A0A4Y1YPH4_9PROT|nr:primosomal replication protein n [Nitrosomonas stercoris]